MKVIIDRFEGFLAVCEKEDKQMIDIKRTSIPVRAKEGDVLEIIDKDTIVIDREATVARKKKIAELTKDLWQ